MNVLLQVLILLLLIFINGLFVAAEFAIIGVRRSRIEYLADKGHTLAKLVQRVITDARRTDRYIATAQIGITLASLGLGMVSEPFIAHLLEGPLEAWFGLSGVVVHTIAFIIALTLITYLHVVLGEMVPKSLSLQNSERMAFMLAVPMNLASKIFSVPVTVLNRIGVLFLRMLQVPPPSEGSRRYTSEELELIVSESHAGGMLEESEQELVANIFDFGERRVVQVMTPHTHIKGIPVTITEDELLQLTESSPHNRFPVYEDNIDNIIGVLHLKDFVRQQCSDEPFNLHSLLRQALFVPENLHVDQLLASFRRQHIHMAVVTDEHGGTMGLITLEDIVEEVIGEVEDEFDIEKGPPLLEVEPGFLIAEGTVPLEDIEEYVDLGEHGYDVETIGGLAMAELGFPLEQGTEFSTGNATIRVEKVDGLSVEQVSVHYSPEVDERGNSLF